MPGYPRAQPAPTLPPPAAPLRFGGDGGAGADRHRSGRLHRRHRGHAERTQALPANIPGMVIVQHMRSGSPRCMPSASTVYAKWKCVRLSTAMKSALAWRLWRLRIISQGCAHGPALHTLLYSGRKGERAPALGGCPLFLNGRLGPLPHGWYHHDGDGRDGASGLLEMRKAGAYTIGRIRTPA